MSEKDERYMYEINRLEGERDTLQNALSAAKAREADLREWLNQLQQIMTDDLQAAVAVAEKRDELRLEVERLEAKVERLRKAACPGCANGLPVKFDAVSGAIHPFPELVNGEVRWNWLAFSTRKAAKAAEEE